MPLVRQVLLAGAAIVLTGAARPQVQTELGVRAKPVIERGALRFKDLNSNGRLDVYEDWRLPPARRAADLVKRMTLVEKAGMMLIATNNLIVAATFPNAGVT